MTVWYIVIAAILSLVIIAVIIVCCVKASKKKAKSRVHTRVPEEEVSVSENERKN